MSAAASRTWRCRSQRTFFGLTDEYMENIYEQFFFLKYSGGWSFSESYNLPANSSLISGESTLAMGVGTRDSTFKREKLNILGIFIGLIGGVFTGLNMVPYLNWEKYNKRIPVHLFTLSQTFGVFLTSSIM